MKKLSRRLALLCVVIVLAVGAAHLVGASFTGHANQPIEMPVPAAGLHPTPLVGL
jgi:hypothetical protein